MQRLVIFTLVIVLLVAAAVTYSRNIRNNSVIRMRVMGTELRVVVNHPGSPEHVKEAVDTIKRIAGLLDKYDEKSELSKINRAAGVEKVAVAKETFAAIEQALFVSNLTRGAFDVTLKDYSKVALEPFHKNVFIKDPKLQIDLGGMGKGFAVEKARQALIKRGVKSALIDMRSSMAAIGGPWKIGLADTKETILLNNGEALSTSGNSEQGEHIVNAKTGKMSATCRSVTVIAKDAGFADALSTAIFVMGPARGIELVKTLEGVKAIVVDSNGKVLKSWQ
ncbi:hypothetical protein A2276_00805 [candidate division WOR-1 bacterium RIFOXYA12_FULL_43_27]|uniref:FAD:protein FMN transferase n=1 Tax=candidate division WOR-1 bacterium RIFOXYC2_FULL_46_14 TaxID=1802587 RepID=A0A1F4U4N4_UNCSA|nr:MAG: hypothetical protein A2276_00805 [candidate division WOR-1 bacterium RIFOXYA12_FULL_43_27]OGC20774.1 MAG: hypothetical protein A2292_07070 [candidate division WOR-1 bacterium RIFOXYB2_FULL_46_45]OGC31489.1 MAG: hypothetical protein A2232_04380 [candidate division WOR-1 bacterium RIFOXYA2_FULL_46_56]OGC39896.1 MAG: hypothetical protein A2438_05220 [candidate division WOR-1 bacterium RIFOXYC2_FULL_46_14]